MGGIDARVSEPMRNRAQINSSFEQVNRRAVPQNVRMNALLCQCRARSGGAFRVAHKNEPCAEAGEPTTTMIAKERLGLVERQSGFVAKLLNEFFAVSGHRGQMRSFFPLARNFMEAGGINRTSVVFSETTS